jgi:hypothetical protein
MTSNSLLPAGAAMMMVVHKPKYELSKVCDRASSKQNKKSSSYAHDMHTRHTPGHQNIRHDSECPLLHCAALACDCAVLLCEAVRAMATTVTQWQCAAIMGIAE